jgi:vomeronasal1 receptor
MSILIAMMIGDLLFVVSMMWTNIYVVSLLYRHHKRAQHIHSPSLSGN